MTLIRELVEMLGGAAKIASALGLPYSTVGSWKARNGIPVEHWQALMRLAVDQNIEGITYESLTLMHAKSSSPAEAVQP